MVWHVNKIFEPRLAYFHKYMSMERMNKTIYVLGIYNAKCYKLSMSSVFMVWLVNDINELKLSFFCNKIFHQKEQIEQNMCLKIYNILR